MENGRENDFSAHVSVFHGWRLPEPATPVGYAALIDAYGLNVPWPRQLKAVGQRHRRYRHGPWELLTPRHAPPTTLQGHLGFALKYEGLDLAVLKRLFQVVGPDPIIQLVRATPTGSYARRIWFLYEWLLGVRLPLNDASKGNFVRVLDPAIQWEGQSEPSPRHRVKNNLPGTASFCPLVFRTDKLNAMVAQDFAGRARAAVAEVSHDVLARTAAFLLLRDSRSSYAIEGEHPPQDRIQRWGRVIGEAGQHPLDRDELVRLQRLVIGDDRFVKIGFREEGGFVGGRERASGLPLPDHISARPEDIGGLVEGLVGFDHGPSRHVDPVIAAAVLAFGFVYVHPFEDGNGRIHRYLIHHVLAEHDFHPAGLVFPVSAVMLDRIDTYRETLEDYSRRLLPAIQWRATETGNVAVLNETADFYRFFDATPHAEFLYDCVERTVEEDLPAEAAFLRRYDAFCRRVQTLVDMPEKTLDLLFRFLQQNAGRLSQRARQKEFAALSNAEVAAVERMYWETFNDDGG